MNLLRIYLDNCCYNRPYDDQSQLRISLESQAKLEIQRLIRNNQLELATSYWTEYENATNPIDIRRVNIQRFQRSFTSVYVSEEADEKVMDIAASVQKNGIKYKDACHVACAILAKCKYLITTDDRLLKYQNEVIKLINPVDFIREMEE